MVAVRLPVSIVWGCACSLALFSLLAHFISRDIALPEFRPATQIEFTPKIKDTPVDSKRKPKPMREPPPLVRTNVRVTSTEGAPPSPTVLYQPPPNAGAIPRGGPPVLAGADRDVIPLVRVSPDYPPSAATRGIEGWVQVQFTVTAIGSVRDAQVVNADPKNVFDDAALKSIARWRYNPKVQDGVGVERVGLQTVIRFTLDPSP